MPIMDKPFQESHEDIGGKFPFANHESKTPRGETADIILQPKRAPVVVAMGALPRIAHVLPELKSVRTPASSPKKRSA